MEKWVALGMQLGYRDEQLHEFVKEQETSEREERHRNRAADRAAKEAEAQRERGAKEAGRADREAERAAKEADAQREREAREAEAQC